MKNKKSMEELFREVEITPRKEKRKLANSFLAGLVGFLLGYSISN